MTSTAATSSFQYNSALGRITQNSQVTSGQTYSFTTYLYNLAGSLKSLTYPSGRTITTSYDDANRVDGVSGQKSGESNKTYASSFTYVSHGAVGSMQLGSTKWEHAIFNSRLQPTEIGLGTSSSDSSLVKFTYGYGTTTNNGNLLSQTIATGRPTFTQNYTYDTLNRLTSAGEGSNWSQTYGYDRFGNRWEPTGSGYEMIPSLVPTAQAEINAASNRFVSPSGYDLAGNLTTDKVGRTMKYDAENRQTEFNGGLGIARYTYDGDGRRVQMDYNGTTTVYAYDAQGRLSAEYKSSSATGTGGTSYVTEDHLGSNRLLADASGNVRARHDYLPFGGELSSSVGRSGIAGYAGTDTIRFRFTQKERDAESGLDYFGFRYFSGAQGRFTSPDPQYIQKEMFPDPQRWNLYAYARNNPLVYVDPTGRTVSLANCSDKQQCAQVLANAAQLPAGVTATPDKNDNLKLGGDLSKIKGGNALRLLQLVQSADKTANFWIGDRAPGLGGGTLPVAGGLSGLTSQGFNQNFAVVQAAPSKVDSGDLWGVFLGADGSVDHSGNIPGANIAEAAAHELLGHVWADLFGGEAAGTLGNKKEAVIAEDRVRNTDPSRGLKISHQDSPQLIKVTDLLRITNPGSQP